MSYGNSRVIIKPRRPHIVYQLHLFFFFQLLAAVTTPSVFVPGPKACPTELPCTHDTRHMRASMVLFNGVATVRASFNNNWSNSTSIISDQLCIGFCRRVETCCLCAWSWPVWLRLTFKIPALTTMAAYWHWNNSILISVACVAMTAKLHLSPGHHFQEVLVSTYFSCLIVENCRNLSGRIAIMVMSSTEVPQSELGHLMFVFPCCISADR